MKNTTICLISAIFIWLAIVLIACIFTYETYKFENRLQITYELYKKENESDISCGVGPSFLKSNITIFINEKHKFLPWEDEVSYNNNFINHRSYGTLIGPNQVLVGPISRFSYEDSSILIKVHPNKIHEIKNKSLVHKIDKQKIESNITILNLKQPIELKDYMPACIKSFPDSFLENRKLFAFSG